MKKETRGRPSKIAKLPLKTVEKLAGYGLIETQIMDILEICNGTFANAKHTPKFLAALKKGKAKADNYVVGSLFHRAIGYSHQEEQVFCSKGQIVRVKTIKHYPPDTMACMYWLNNRLRNEWKVRQEIEGNVNLNFTAEEREKKLDWLSTFTTGSSS